MIHFWYSISISISDTFQVYQYHKSLIHDCDTFTGIIQNSLLTKFAKSWTLHSECHNCESNSYSSPCFLETNRDAEDDFFDCGIILSNDSAISAVDRECTWVTLTLNWKCWQDTIESGKFWSNSTQLYHCLHHSSKKTVQHGWTDRTATPQPSEDSMFEKLLLMKANHSLFYNWRLLTLLFVFPPNSTYFTVYFLMQTLWEVAY